MAIPTFCIGLLPTYEQIGIWAPILLLLCRIFQGLSVGGEYTGSFVYLVETAPKGEKGRMGCWADIGCFLGTMMGTLSVALLTQTLSQEAFTSYGWRIPFFAGILLGVVGFFMRKSLRESNDFTKSPTIKHPIHHLLTKQRRLFFASIALIALNAMGFYMITVFIGNQTIALGKIPASEAYALNAFALLCITVATLTIARFVDTYDTVKLYKIGCFASAVLAYPLFYSLVYGSMAMQIVLMGLFSIAISFTFAPRSYFLVNTFSPATRFTAVALCMSIANAVFGGMTPLVATTLIKESGIAVAPFTMIIIAALITWFAINVISREKIKISHSKHLDKAA
jgi:MHS family proline/betaine transporter-like MFS transporter